VAAFYAQKGRRVYAPDELRAEQRRRQQELEAAQRNPQLMARKMQEAMAAGKDPQALMREMAASMGGGDKNWVKGLAAGEGVQQLRFLPLDDALARMALIFRDELLGRTAIVFLDVPSPGDLEAARRMSASPPDTEWMMKRMAAEQLLAEPTIDQGRE
jgi:hypothetical protein